MQTVAALEGVDLSGADLIPRETIMHVTHCLAAAAAETAPAATTTSELPA